jgi:hypothetical protein
MPGIQGIGPKGPYRRPVLATRALLVQARGQAGKAPKWGKNRPDDRDQGQMGNFGPCSGSLSRFERLNPGFHYLSRGSGRSQAWRDCGMADRKRLSLNGGVADAVSTKTYSAD